jgi:hypothetical protein
MNGKPEFAVVRNKYLVTERNAKEFPLFYLLNKTKKIRNQTGDEHETKDIG